MDLTNLNQALIYTYKYYDSLWHLSFSLLNKLINNYTMTQT